MGKVTKKVWIILIIVALALPIFVGCEPEPEAPPVDPVAVAKAAFLNAVNGEVDEIDTNVATVALDGQDFVVTFKTSITTDDIKTAANSFFEAVLGLSSTAKLKINNGPTEYTSANKAALKTALITYIYGEGSAPKTNDMELSYSATVTYGGQTFNLAGTVEFKDIPNLPT